MRLRSWRTRRLRDLLQIAGQQDKVKLTGTANIDAHAAGTLRSLAGTGNVTLTNGDAYGEPYQTIAVDISAQGTEINATRLLVQAHEMSIHGRGSYDIASKHVAAHVTGNNLRLSKLQLIRKANPDADAVVSLNVDADGTIQEPNLHAQVQLADITYQGKKLGVLSLNANSDRLDLELSDPVHARGRAGRCERADRRCKAITQRRRR